MRPNSACFRLLSLLSLLFALLFVMPATGQTFAQPTVVPTGNWPAAIYTADVNGDGIPDLIYIDQGATSAASVTHVLIGHGNGSFTQTAQIATAGSSLAIADFDGDGHLDIAWADQVGANAVGHLASGRGDGTFAAPNVYGAVPVTGSKPAILEFPTAVQFQDAGHPYLFVEDAANQFLYFITDRAPLAATLKSTGLPDGAGPILTAQLTATQHHQYAIVGSDGTLDVYFPNGAGGFSPSPNGFGFDVYKGSGSIHSALFQDVNLDGRPDLIAEGLNGRIDVFPGNGDGTFSTTSIGGTGTLDGLTGNGGHLIAIADLNHDGQVDALTATPAGISTLFGAGTSYLKLGGIYNAGPGHTSYAVADFNGDGNLDLAVDSPEGITLLFGNPDGSFQTSRAYAAGAPALSGALAAFTQSGHLDSAVSIDAAQAQFLRGNGDGTFTANASPTAPQPGIAGLWSVLQTGDFNADGKQDLVLTADGNVAKLYGPSPNVHLAYGVNLQYGNGDGTFGPVTGAYLVPNQCPINGFGTSAVGDFSAIGVPGIANLDPTANEWIYTSHVPFVFASEDHFLTGGCTIHSHDLIAAADLNQDGTPDLVLQNDSHLFVQFSTPNKGGFPADFTLTPSYDLAVDGSLTTPGQLTAPNISTTFGGTSTTFNQPYFPGAIATADLDRDGNTDLLVTYANLAADPTNPSTSTPNYLYLWYGSGGGKFLTSAAHPVNPVRIQLSRNYYQVAVADLNNDGIPDLFLSDGYIVSYQLGLGDGTFGPEHHLLAGRGINTISTADLRGIGRQDLVLANGGAALSNPVANHETLAADPDVNTGGITVLLNTLPKATLTSTLTASPEPSVYNAPYRITATLSGSPLPTGTVTFSVDGTVLGSVTATNGAYSIAGPNLLPGTHTLTATYAGDTNYPAQSLTPGTHVITRAPTTVILNPSTPLTVYYGQPIDGRFAIYDSQGNGITALNSTGTYSLYDNGQLVSSCTNLLISAPCPYGNPQLLDAGTHAFAVAFNGDPINAPSLSPTVTFTVRPDLTSVSLYSSKNPANLGDSVTFTALITGNYLPPDGTVNFYDTQVLIGSGTLTSGPNLDSTTTFTTATLSAGLHHITALYTGNANFNNTPAILLNQVILSTLLGTIPSITTLTSNLNPSAPQQLVTFTVQVQVPGVFPTIPSGTVTFLDGTNPLGTVTLNTFGIGIFQTATLTTGTHPLTASYAGSTSTTAAAILPSVSPVLNQLVTIPLSTAPAGFQMTVTPGALTLGVGRTGILAINILATGGFNQPVQLSCSHLAPETSCQFSPSAIVPPGGGNVTLQLFTNAPRDCNTDDPYFLGSTRTPRSPIAPGIAAATLLFLAIRRRRFRGLLLLLATLTALTTLSGCGHCTDLGTKPGNYSFTITAAAQGTPITESRTATIPLTMTIP